MTEQRLNKRSFNYFNKAINQYQLLQDGEKVLIGVSGGVDSLVLTHLFSVFNQRRHKNWDVLAVHIEPGFPNWKTTRLIKYFESLKIRYLISSTDVPEKLKQVNTEKFSPCFFCARERRKRMFEIANENGIEKIALAHHLEDVNETLFLNLFYTSTMSTFTPKQYFFKGKFHIIRPLYFFDKELILQYANIYGLPKIKNQCPHEKESERERIRKFLKSLYKKNPRIKTNIFWGIKNVKLQYLP